MGGDLKVSQHLLNGHFPPKHIPGTRQALIVIFMSKFELVWGDTVGSAERGAIISVGDQRAQSSG